MGPRSAVYLASASPPARLAAFTTSVTLSRGDTKRARLPLCGLVCHLGRVEDPLAMTSRAGLVFYVVLVYEALATGRLGRGF